VTALAVLTPVIWMVSGTTAPVADPIAWVSAPGRECPSVAQLETAYARLGPNPHPTATPVRVEIDSSSPSIAVRLSLPGLPPSTTRRLEAGRDSCEEIAQTIAILVRAWIAHVPELANGPEVSEPARQPTVESTVALGTASAGTARVEGRPISSAFSMGLALAAGVDLLLSPDLSATAAVALSLELRVSPAVAVGLLGSWMGDVSIDDAPYGSIVVQRQLLGASVAVAIPGVEGWGIRGLSADVLGALALWHGNAQSYGYPTTSDSQIYEPGVMGAVRFDEKLGGPLFLRAQVSALALVRTVSLQVSRPDSAPTTVGELSWFTLAFGLGLGVEIL
jgi:hypothetical protein